MSDSKYSFEMEHAVFEILDFLQAQFGQRKLCINTGNRSIKYDRKIGIDQLPVYM